MKSLIATLLFLLSTLSFAQGPEKAPPSTDKARQAEIENAIVNRISVQNDFWFDDGDFPRIIQLLRLTYEYTPWDYEVATNLGWMLGNIEEYGQELAAYTRFRKDNPQDPDAAYPEAQFYFLKRAYAKVPPLLEDSIKVKAHPNNYRVLAHAYDRMGMKVDCVRVWESYMKLYPLDEAGKANLIKAKAKLQSDGGPIRKRK